jgi:diacylglycerol kinase family enzyme
MRKRRVAALASLAFATASAGLTAAVAIAEFPRGVLVVACLVAAILGLAFGVLHLGPARVAGFALVGLALAGVLTLVLVEGRLLESILIVLLASLSVLCAREAFVARAQLPRAPAPSHPVLFFNPLSGGGKAEELNLAEEARTRGIEAIELRRGDDLRALVRQAVDRGADALAMAGGDGSQAIVAEIAAEIDLPYACVPAGTRNHFALDLGVDRDDVVGGLDAFVEGGERRVDLAEVNGCVFVNNVSLGIYADAVQRAGYRDAKLRTLLQIAPERLGPEAERSDLRWDGYGGRDDSATIAILISNNRYRVGSALSSGTRPQMDAGVLGITVLTAAERPGVFSRLRPRWRQWERSTFRVDAGSPIAAGIDGEAAMLDPPLRFRTRHRVLRVRIADGHPGASPSAGIPNGALDAIRSLGLIAAGRYARSESQRGGAAPRPNT